MSRFTTVVRFANILPSVILAVAFSLMSSSVLSAASTPAPQLLPYKVTAVAGGGTNGTTGTASAPYATAAPYTVGNYCGTNTTTAPSGLLPAPLTSWPKATNTVGDGCLATQVLLPVPRAAAADSQGNLFIVDATNQSIRRVDAQTGIITTIAGSTAGTATTTTIGGACPSGSLTATDVIGGGCLATQIIQAAPEGIAVDASDNVWFTDYTLGAVREVVMSGSNAGVLKTIVNTSGASGYKTDNAAYTATGITAANGKLYRPYGLTFDKNGNLYIADNSNNVVDVVNLGSAATSIAGVTVPAGEIYTIAGSGCPYVSSAGCTTSAYYGSSNGTGAATSSKLRAPYQVAVDNSGNIYIADEYYYDVRVITGGTISTFVGVPGTYGSTLPSHVATTAAVENVYGVATDANGNVYFSDGYSTTTNYVARVDIATNMMYTIIGQLSTGVTYCLAKTDSVGDGCPGLQATVYKPYQPSVDAVGNLYITDQGNYLIRKISVGTQFGSVGANQPTQYVKIHFGAGDSPASSTPYQLTAGAANFSFGTATCTINTGDTTQDCVLPITATPSVPGAFTGTLEVMATNGGLADFTLSGNFVQTPLTSTAVTAVPQSISCTDTTDYSTSTPVILTAKLFSNGVGTPTGTVTFYANGTQIGTAQTLANGTSATLTYTFATAGSYAITATYTPTTGSYYSGSTSSALNVISAAPSLSGSTITYQQSTVSAGQTALYSLNIVQNVYAGTINFSCSGLPANSSCVFTPSSFTATGCQTSNTVAMSILTQQGPQSIAASLVGDGRGPWAVLSILSCIGLVLLIRVRRRQLLRYSQIWMVLAALLAVAGIASCNGTIQTTRTTATPAGSYNIVVTATGSTGTTFSFPAVTLTVH